MESKQERINIDKLLITELSNDGTLVRRDILIPHPHTSTLSKLQDMSANPNRSLLEMQDVFKQDVYSQDEHNVCLVHEYNEAYVHPASYPKLMSYSEYNDIVSEHRRNLEHSKDKNGRKLSREQIEERLVTYILSLKREFLAQAERYILAEDYISIYRQTVTLDALKIISEEKIGWSVYEHQPNPDTSFKIRTNYGYGSSAYFRVSMCYKGVEILPYSHVVTYAIAKMEDLVRATRNYSALRENWPLAMDFMIETSNMALQNEEEFLKVWLKNEIDEMMSGLRRICSNPESMIARYEENIGKKTPYLAVRNFTEDEVKHYKARKDEMNVSLKSSKMYGALMFLDNLQSIARVFGYVDDALVELKNLALSIIPEITRLVSSLNMELSKLKKELGAEKFKLKSLEKQLIPYTRLLERMYIEQVATSYEIKSKIEREFRIENKAFNKLKNDISEQQRSVWKKEAFFSARESFRDNLVSQKEMILLQVQKIS